MRITDEAEAFCRLAKHVSQAVVTIGIGKICRNLSEIPESYRGAREAVSYRSLYGAGKAINIGEIAPGEERASDNSQKKLLALFKAVKMDRYGADLRGGRAAVPQCSQHGFHTAGGLALQGIPHDAGAAAEQQG